MRLVKYRFSLIILIAIVFVLVLSGCVKGDSDDDAVDDVQIVKITAVDWEFIPGNIEVSTGQVKFIVENKGKRMHGLGIKELDFDVRVAPGETVEKTIDISNPGTYEFECTVLCGTLEQHHEMHGILIVE